MTVAAEPTAGRRRMHDFALRAGPVVGIYAALCVLYAWQASKHVTPTIFVDELEFAQISRSIADVGEALQRGAPAKSWSLAYYLAAPAWWLNDVTSAYAAIKLLHVLVMTSAILPAYAMARLVVSRPWALFVGAGTVAAPALAYAPILVKEPLAYPLATAALWLTLRFVLRPSVIGLGLAAAVCVLAMLTRTQLAVLFATLGLSAAAVGWRSARVRAWRTRWTRWDMTGAVVLVVLAAALANQMLSRRSQVWYESTTFFKGDMLELGVWALGALTIGLGIVPLTGTIATLLGHGSRGREPDPAVRAYTTVAIAAIATFTFYTALKAAYLAHHFAELVEERNLIYLGPVLLLGMAIVLERRVVRLWALAVGVAATAYVIVVTPFRLEYPYYEAHGFSILAFANRKLIWDGATIQSALLWFLALTGIGLALVVVLRSRRALVASSLALAIAGLVLVWTLTTQIYAANGEHRFSEQLRGGMLDPPNWIDRTTGGKPVVFLGEQLSSDPNPLSLLEFWNRSLKGVWSLDGTAPILSGPVVTPDLAAPDGTLFPNPRAGYVVTTDGVRIVGANQITPTGVYRLVPLDGKPIRLTESTTGVDSDAGWMGSAATYTKYDVPPGQRGTVTVNLSREAWGGTDVPGHVTIRAGPVAVDPKTHQPTLARETARREVDIHAAQILPPVTLPAPRGPFRVEVTVDPTFSPHELDSSLTDTRQLGAQVSFGYAPAAR